VPEVHQQLTDMGLTVGYMTPRQLDERERAYTQVWSRIIRTAASSRCRPHAVRAQA
jgi:hypothetical protein